MTVDLRSSTEPHVTRRSSSACWACSEIADTLAVLHCGFGEAIVCARLAALGHARRGDLVHDLTDRGRVRNNATGARHVADCAEAHGCGEEIFVVHAFDELARGVKHPVAPEDLAVVREVDPRQLELLARDVLPDVELGPVGDRKDAHMLALADARVVDVPQLWALHARVPLAEIVTEREDALLRARALLVATRATDCGVELMLLDGVEQRRRLQAVARCARSRLLDNASLVDRLLDRGNDQPLVELAHAPVAELDHLGEVVARV